MDKRIAIILTSIERPLALKKSVESILANWQDCFVLMVGLQDDYRSESTLIASKLQEDNSDKNIRLYDLGYDVGISKARNELIQKAHLWNCSHILLSADSILFNETSIGIYFATLSMKTEGYDLCGFNLLERIPWEAKLELIPNQSFQLDFIDPNEKKAHLLVPCDIVRNFWIARTETLIKVGYDDNLMMAEHEDFFHRYKEAGYKVCCTNLVNGLYEKGTNTPEYDKIRATNFRIGMQRLKDKYSLKTWVTYKNLENTKL
jgi:hypothetical protein